ncbi:hypothetical protein FA95DRAFT_1572628 [Auriscalpium vulgare]|uniref:Uncharacterized protein n=1 Tax=Auriscalpium vulgare TaxID=40419 RepID=A0ACB8RTB5_9AGAM|nr:hypothetical protein FA95DRAFT_1572628 [Auriscalpium vulgare]
MSQSRLTPEQGYACQQYANVVLAWVTSNSEAPFPGPPRTGYDLYRLRHPHALWPEDFTHLMAVYQPPAPHPYPAYGRGPVPYQGMPTQGPGAEVMLSARGLDTILERIRPSYYRTPQHLQNKKNGGRGQRSPATPLTQRATQKTAKLRKAKGKARANPAPKDSDSVIEFLQGSSTQVPAEEARANDATDEAAYGDWGDEEMDSDDSYALQSAGWDTPAACDASQEGECKAPIR